MKRIGDQLLLLIYCVVATLPKIGEISYLTALLYGIIYISVNYGFPRLMPRIILASLYGLLALFFPTFLCFLPVIAYPIIRHRNYLWLIPGGLLCLYHLVPGEISMVLLILTGVLMALILNLRTGAWETLELEYRKTRDDSTELNLLLKEKNKALLEKQDYEIYTATLKERNRIAREIHDNVGHMLSRSILMTGALQAVNQSPALKKSLEQLEATLNSAMTSIRESVHDLHDESVDLRDVLENLMESFTFCKKNLEYDMGPDVPRQIKYTFIAVIKEALNNITRHSNCTAVSIVVREHPGLYQLAIHDNGTSCRQPEHSGLGLINMQERTESLGGTMQISTEKGFRIFITVPKEKEEAL